MLNKIALFFTASVLSTAAFAGNTVLAKTPFSAQVPHDATFPAVERVQAIEGMTVGQRLQVQPGGKLVDLSIAPKTITPAVEVVKDLTISSESAVLHLKAGAKVFPESRIVDKNGKSYYLIKADHDTFLRITYFAITDEGAILDRAFVPTSDTYTPRGGVTITPGQLVVSKAIQIGAKNCGISALYLGTEEGVTRVKVIRADTKGAVTGEKLRAFAADLKSITLPGTELWFERNNTNGATVRIVGVEPFQCQGSI